MAGLMAAVIFQVLICLNGGRQVFFRGRKIQELTLLLATSFVGIDGLCYIIILLRIL